MVLGVGIGGVRGGAHARGSGGQLLALFAAPARRGSRARVSTPRAAAPSCVVSRPSADRPRCPADGDPARRPCRGRRASRPRACTRAFSSWPRSASQARSSALPHPRGEAAADVLEPHGLRTTLHDTRLWWLCGGSSLYVAAQIAVTGFVVLFLHDERGFSPGEAAAVLAGDPGLRRSLRIAPDAGRTCSARGSSRSGSWGWRAA